MSLQIQLQIAHDSSILLSFINELFLCAHAAGFQFRQQVHLNRFHLALIKPYLISGLWLKSMLINLPRGWLSVSVVISYYTDIKVETVGIRLTSLCSWSIACCGVIVLCGTFSADPYPIYKPILILLSFLASSLLIPPLSLSLHGFCTVLESTYLFSHYLEISRQFCNLQGHFCNAFSKRVSL